MEFPGRTFPGILVIEFRGSLSLGDRCVGTGAGWQTPSRGWGWEIPPRGTSEFYNLSRWIKRRAMTAWPNRWWEEIPLKFLEILFRKYDLFPRCNGWVCLSFNLDLRDFQSPRNSGSTGWVKDRCLPDHGFWWDHRIIRSLESQGEGYPLVNVYSLRTWKIHHFS